MFLYVQWNHSTQVIVVIHCVTLESVLTSKKHIMFIENDNNNSIGDNNWTTPILIVMTRVKC